MFSLKRALLPSFTLALLVLAFAAAAAPVSAVRETWDVRDFGATADGQTLDTKAIQSAVDACAEAGGGTVTLQGGTFLSGTIVLRSHVTLAIASGAVLRGSSDSDDYPAIQLGIPFLYRDRFKKSLIYAEGQENIALIGRGEIDGQGALFPARPGDDDKRPYLIRFSECTNVQVRDLTLRDSARWLSHYLACTNVTIDGVTIRSPIRENRDGIGIDSCDRVRIANCDIDTGDDAIVLKATANRPCRRVTVVNCTLRSQASALKLGTESQGGFEDITFSNCVIHDTPGTAIKLGMVDGGIAERINVSNITMRNVQVALFVRLGNRATPLPGQPKPGIGRMRDVTISNIQADGVEKFGCSITGLPGHPVENVTLQNIRLRFVGGGTLEDAARTVPEREASYPVGRMFGVLPAYGFYLRHAKGLSLHNLDLSFEEEDARPAIVADDVADLNLFALRAQISPAASSVIQLHNVRGALIHGCQSGKANTFARVSGAGSNRIAFRGNDLSTARHPTAKSDEVLPNAISMERQN